MVSGSIPGDRFFLWFNFLCGRLLPHHTNRLRNGKYSGLIGHQTKCISQESNPGHIDGNDVCYHWPLMHGSNFSGLLQPTWLNVAKRHGQCPLLLFSRSNSLASRNMQRFKSSPPRNWSFSVWMHSKTKCPAINYNKYPDKPVIAQLVKHLTVDSCSNQMVPGSIPGDRISLRYCSTKKH